MTLSLALSLTHPCHLHPPQSPILILIQFSLTHSSLTLPHPSSYQSSPQPTSPYSRPHHTLPQLGAITTSAQLGSPFHRPDPAGRAEATLKLNHARQTQTVSAQPQQQQQPQKQDPYRLQTTTSHPSCHPVNTTYISSLIHRSESVSRTRPLLHQTSLLGEFCPAPILFGAPHLPLRLALCLFAPLSLVHLGSQSQSQSQSNLQRANPMSLPASADRIPTDLRH